MTPTYIARPQSKFPGSVYRNKTQFNGKIYSNIYSKCWAIFNMFTYGIETFVILWDQLLYPCVAEVCRLGLEPLWHSSVILKPLKFNQTGISWGLRKDGPQLSMLTMRFALCSSVSCFGTHLVHYFLNNRCSVTILCNKEREICICCHSWRWISIGSVYSKILS